jgi:hypothetical protein
MKYYALGAEAAGDFGKNTVRGDVSDRPPKISYFHFELERYPHDDLLEALATYAITEQLAEALSANKLTGFEFGDVEISFDEQFHVWAEMHKGEELPKYMWLKVTGRPGIDDFGMVQGPCKYPLVVSDKAMRVLKQFKLSFCDIENYKGQELSAAG